MRKILTFIKKLFCKTDIVHPLNDAIMRLTMNKTFDFAKGKRSVVNGYCMVKGVRQDMGVNYVDVLVKITQDEPKRYYKSEWRRRKFRKANIKYYIKHSELSHTVRMVGMKTFRIGNITLI
jgi:hypothetical protein